MEVTTEDDGQTACHYTARSQAEAAGVIARLPMPGHPQIQAVTSDTATATWDGTDIEWHYQPPAGQPADPGQITAVLLAHLAVLDGRHDWKDDPREQHRCR